MEMPLAFNSGNIRAISETKAFIRISAPIGITADSQENIMELACEYAFAGGQVFIDSGAFTAFNKGIDLDIDSAIGKDFWDKVFHKYFELAEGAGPGVLNMRFVAPDQVGNREITTKNVDWLTYKINDLHALGCKIIQNIQKDKFNNEVADIFINIADISGWYNHFEDVVIGFPSKAKAWNLNSIYRYVEYMKIRGEECDWPMEPLEIHLMGKGDPVQLVEICYKMNKITPTILSGDSVATASIVGKGKRLTEDFNKLKTKMELKLYRYLSRPERGRLRGYLLGEIETEKREKARKLFKELNNGNPVQQELLA